LLLAVFWVAGDFSAGAQEAPDLRKRPDLIPFNIMTGQFSGQELSGRPGRKAPEIPPPAEPRIDPVTFLQPEPPASLSRRVEALVHGINTDIPPEFDHYGYEIRRYMAHIGGPEVYKDAQAQEKALADIGRAEIILRYWREALSKEIDGVGKAIEEGGAGTRPLKTKFKYNSGVVKAFFTEAQNWIDNNKALVEFLSQRHGHYKFKYPYITFFDARDMRTFAALLTAREKSRQQVAEYLPFGIMVY